MVKIVSSSQVGRHLLIWLIAGVVVLFLTTSVPVRGHGDDMTKDGKDDDDDDDDKAGGMKDMDKKSPAEDREEKRRKRQFLLVAHALIASFIVFVTMPISVALISGKKIELHRNLTSVNTLMLLFVGLIAAVGFADGESWHAKIAFACLGAWIAQAAYGWVRHYFYRKMSIKPHRSFGMVLFVYTMITWASGVLHVLGSCNAAEDIQMCNAHFYLGALFVIVGLVNGYYAPEFAAKVEMCLIAIGGVSELVGEGLGDLILNAIDPATFKWDSMAKVIHLTTASVWVLCAIVGWAVAIKRPFTLSRGVGLTLGCFFHLLFMFSHGADASPRTQAAHLIHELALVPVLITRPTARLPVVTQYLLIIAGFAFIMAADPVTRDVGDIPPPWYVILILLFAGIFHVVHRAIQKLILRKDPSESMMERTGWAQPVYCCVGCMGRLCCCCPGLTVEEGEVLKVNQGSKYQHLESQVGPEEDTKLHDLDEDVTSPPPNV